MPALRSVGPERRLELLLRRCEEREVDRRRHRLVSRGIRMQMVALVELRPDVAWLSGVDHGLVEIDDAVELAAVADELVDRHADGFLLGRVIAFERRAG